MIIRCIEECTCIADSLYLRGEERSVESRGFPQKLLGGKILSAINFLRYFFPFFIAIKFKFRDPGIFRLLFRIFDTATKEFFLIRLRKNFIRIKYSNYVSKYAK